MNGFRHIATTRRYALRLGGRGSTRHPSTSTCDLSLAVSMSCHGTFGVRCPDPRSTCSRSLIAHYQLGVWRQQCADDRQTRLLFETAARAARKCSLMADRKLHI